MMVSYILSFCHTSFALWLLRFLFLGGGGGAAAKEIFLQWGYLVRPTIKTHGRKEKEEENEKQES